MEEEDAVVGLVVVGGDRGPRSNIAGADTGLHGTCRKGTGERTHEHLPLVADRR